MNTDDDNNYDFEEIITSSDSSSNIEDSSTTTVASIKKEKPKRNVSGIEKKLWTIAKKYKSLLDKGEVPKVAESEDDRKEVEDAYLELSSKRHWQLDARVYQSLTKMQRTRDAKIALEGTTEKDRLRMIAWEVKTRTQAVIFIPGDSTLEMDIFNMHNENNVRIIEGDSKELLIEDNILENKGIAIIENLPLRKLTKEEKKNLKKEVLRKYGGKVLTRKELNSTLNSIDADLVSLMVREGLIVLLKIEPSKYQILAAEEAKKELEEKQVESISLAIIPKREDKPNKK